MESNAPEPILTPVDDRPSSVVARRSHPLARRIGWVVVTVLSVLVGAYAVAVVATGFAIVPAEVTANHFPTALGLRVHIVAAGVTLLVGPFQFLRPLRRQAPRVHHWMGRTYILACLVGGLAGGSIALFSASGLVAGAGFFALAICWLFCTVRAYLAVRTGDYVTHQRWMTRSFALAFAAVMLRIYLPLSLVAGIEYADAYPVIAWACWVPNLIVAQFLVASARGE
jgi:uncharacterized membrane protein